MVKADIVLITFPFTDLKGSKLRPAVVLAETNLDITVCFITTPIQSRDKNCGKPGRRTLSIARIDYVH